MLSRRLAASALTLGAVTPVTYKLLSELGGRSDPPVVVWGALLAVVIAAALVFVPRLEPQILTRAVLWGTMVAGALISFVADTSKTEAHVMSLAMVLCSGLALLLLAKAGLDAPPARAAFVPVAFRGVLVAIMVMALADTATLLFWGGLVLEASSAEWALLPYFFGSGALMLLALYGLYSLRVWGFLLNMIANVVVATFAWLVPDMPTAIAACLSATAAAQLVVGLPFLRGLATREERPWLPASVTRAIAAGVVVGVMLASVAARVVYSV